MIDREGKWNETAHRRITNKALLELMNAGEIKKLSKREIKLIVDANIETDDITNSINHGYKYGYGLTMAWAVHCWVPANLAETPEQRAETIKVGKVYRQNVIDQLYKDINNAEEGSDEYYEKIGQLSHIEEDPSADSHGWDVVQVINNTSYPVGPMLIPGTSIIYYGNQQYYNALKHGKGDDVAPNGTATKKQEREGIEAAKTVFRKTLGTKTSPEHKEQPEHKGAGLVPENK